ncbi:hypothetical protein [Amycolatopsis jejuensis]|uniref:hypothetical protein n=1 Tax=Amycolatopsis jejuensis TaxID=330084 RepID=UPI00068B35F3|nr:hypothetical protein [Amycolatopsis jejuensis]
MPDVKHFDPSAVTGTVTRLLSQRGWAGTGIADVVDHRYQPVQPVCHVRPACQDLCLAARRRCLAEHSVPRLAALETGGRGAAGAPGGAAGV